MKPSPFVPCVLLSLSLLFPACAGKEQDKKAVATVNDAAILLPELEKEVARSARQDPAAKLTSRDVEDSLKTMIERKLMIQEAVKRGLASDERFVQTIKNYWEQTLIRELIDAKNRELTDTLYVTEDQIGQEYRRMQSRIIVRAARANSPETAEAVRQKMAKGAAVAGADLIGPSLYDDLRNSPLGRAFDLEQGETKVLDHDGGYIVVLIVKQEKIALPPLADVHGKIKDLLLDQQRQNAIAAWVETLKRSSNIRINKELLKEAGHER